MTVHQPIVRPFGEIDNLIGRAEEMCARYRLAAKERHLDPRSANAIQRQLRNMEATLARLRAQRAGGRLPNDRDEPNPAGPSVHVRPHPAAPLMPAPDRVATAASNERIVSRWRRNQSNSRDWIASTASRRPAKRPCPWRSWTGSTRSRTPRSGVTGRIPASQSGPCCGGRHRLRPRHGSPRVCGACWPTRPGSRCRPQRELRR